MLVSTHNLGSVPEFCDRTVLLNRTVLAYGPTVEIFTQANLEKTFGGVLRHFVLGEGEGGRPRALDVITDDERPVIFDGDRRPRATASGEGAHGDVLLLEPFAYGYMVNAMWVSRAGRRGLRIPLRLSDAEGLVADRRRAVARHRARCRRRLHARPAVLGRGVLLGRRLRQRPCFSSTSAPS